MSMAQMLVLLLLGWADQPDPAMLVDQLGAARYADRQRAADALEKLGGQALPALRGALESKDPEVRSRAASLIEKIDSELLTRPTLIALDFQDKPVDAVAAAISEQSGIKLILEPANHPMWKTRRVTLREPEPVAFWKAIDLLSRAASIAPNPAAQMADGGRTPVLRLYSGSGPVNPTCDSGPFRISLVSVHHHRDLMLSQFPGVARMLRPRPPGAALPKLAGVPAPPTPAMNANDQFYVQMQVMVEPRLMLNQSHELKMTEAVDNRGQSLLPPTAGVGAQRYAAYYGFNPGGFLQLPLYLAYPEEPGKTIAKLRGVLPVTVSARKPNALVVPLKEESVGKTFHNADAQLVFKELKSDPKTERTTISFNIRLLTPEADNQNDPAMPVFGGALRINGLSGNQIEILDAQGRQLHGAPASINAPQLPSDGMSFTFTLMQLPGRGAPAEMRYYSLSRATAEVPFEFKDIPMP